LDWAKRQDPDGTIAAIAEVMHESNNILGDALVLPGNLETGNRITQRSSLPAPGRRRVNRGVASTKSTTKQVTETVAIYGDWAKIDLLQLDLMADPATFIASEHEAHLEGLTQAFASEFIYGNHATDPDGFTGLTPRYNALGDSLFQVVTAGGSTNLSSIWWVTYGPGKTHLHFPKNTKSGISFKDYNDLPVTDDDGNEYPGYRRYYEWQVGLSVKDPRFNVRIANIDTAALADAGESGFDGAELELLMIDAINKMPNMFDPAPANSGQMSRHVCYMNGTVYTAMERLATTKPNGQFAVQQFGGLPVLTYRGYPIRRVDKITNAETAVS
jgi:hypothetical protein